MKIKRLSKDIVEKTRSSFTVNSISQCVFELVSNSIDAQSSAIAVRINLITLRIQVVDNSSGISKENLEHVGIRYMTSKCSSLDELEKHVHHYGFRGEAVASIVNLSKRINITSKTLDSVKTYSKTIENGRNGEVKEVKNRPSRGTTITVDGFLTTVPVRQKRLISEIEFETVRNHLKCLIIIHPKISFSLRDDVTGTLALTSQKNRDIIDSFRSLHPEIDEQFKVLKVSKHKVSVEGLIHKNCWENKKMQYVYVNKRPVICHKTQRLICDLFLKINPNKAKTHKKYPIFVVNIKCPHSYVDILLSPSKTRVELKHFDLIQHCIEKMIHCFFGTDIAPTKINRNIVDNYRDDCGISQVKGAIQACGFKRKYCIPSKKIIPKKSTKIDDGKVDGNIGQDVTEPHEIFAGTSFKKLFKENEILKPKPSIKTPFVRDKTKKQTQNTMPSGNYYIEDSAEPQDINKNSAFVQAKFKKPLPITILQKNQILPKPIHTDGEKAIEQTSALAKPEFDAKSAYTEFTNDENKGKNLIMDMFLKSTQVFNSDSESTVSETIQESNFVIEKNVQDHVRGFNTTMSISVNVKRRKLKQKTNQNHDHMLQVIHDKTSKCVQTSVADDKKMVSKCIQTTMNYDFNQEQAKDILPSDAVAENYTVIVASTVSKNHRLKFVKKRFPKKAIKEKPLKKLESTCNCNKSRYFNFKRLKSADEKSMCDKVNNKLKIFSSQSTASLENTDISPIKVAAENVGDERHENIHNMVNNVDNDVFFSNRQNPVHVTNYPQYFQQYHLPLNNHFLIPQNRQHVYGIPVDREYPINHAVRQYPLIQNNIVPNTHLPSYPIMPNLQPQLQDNFIATSQFQNQDSALPSFKFFIPQSKSTQINEMSKNVQHPIRSPFWGNEKYVKTSQYRNKEKSNIFSEPVFQNSDLNQSDLPYSDSELNLSEDLFGTNNNFRENLGENLVFTSPQNRQQMCYQSNKNHSAENESSLRDKMFKRDKVKTINPSISLGKLVITLSEKDKNKLLEMELQEDKMRNQEKFLDEEASLSDLTSDLKAKDKSRIIMDSQNLWIRKVNGFGEVYYVNQRTGMGTCVVPKNDQNTFQFEKRLGFIPIGTSPILKSHKPVDKFLSQSAKSKLHNFIMQSYENELLVIKWANYIEDEPNKFFEDLYLEKAKLYETSIPTVVKHHSNIESGITSFNKTLFRNLDVIGQVDRKFIAVLERTKNMLILFDQHAVHERIRLENLLKAYNAKTETCKEKMLFFIPQNDISILKKHEDCLNSVGLEVEFFSNGLNVTKIPSCLHQKFNANQDSNNLNGAIHDLLKEVIDWLKSTRGTSFLCVPKVIQNTINLEACRGAIKFGDVLTETDCAALLKELGFCNLPFQCAHGRPTLTPLLTVQKTNNKMQNVF